MMNISLLKDADGEVLYLLQKKNDGRHFFPTYFERESSDKEDARRWSKKKILKAQGENQCC
jgi:hypothetical protein